MNQHNHTHDLAAPLPEAAVAGLTRIQRLALTIGAVGVLACGIGAVISFGQFLQAYLVAYIFVIGIVLGSLAIVMVHHLSGGAWGIVIRRPLESATRTLPLMALLFLPLALGVVELYPWAQAEHVASEPILRHKQPYLNVPFFLIRAVIYFALWNGIAYVLNKWSLEQDRVVPRPSEKRFRLLSAPGLLVYALTVTFMSIDWAMSLEPEWFSTIYGILFMGGQGLSAMAFVISVLFLLSNYRPMSEALTPSHFHDLGKLMFAFVMLWAYFTFSQFLIIWSGNLPEEIPWYLRRMEGVWGWIIVFITVAHFALPFLLLLSRDLKRSAPLLSKVAMGLLLMRFVDLVWLIAPAFSHGEHHGSISWLHPAALAAVGGLWLWYFIRQMQDRPLLPINDPYLEKALEHAAH